MMTTMMVITTMIVMTMIGISEDHRHHWARATVAEIVSLARQQGAGAAAS